MPIDYEKLIRREVCRRVTPSHSFFDDLCQEARIAIYAASDKLDTSLPLSKQYSFLKYAVRWHITKAWHIWLRESYLVSARSLREGRAKLDKVKKVDSVVLENMPSSGEGVDAQAIDAQLLEKMLEAFSEAISTEREYEAFVGLIEEYDSRTLGKKLGMSHQGAINVQNRLLKRVKSILKRKNVKDNSD